LRRRHCRRKTRMGFCKKKRALYKNRLDSPLAELGSSSGDKRQTTGWPNMLGMLVNGVALSLSTISIIGFRVNAYKSAGCMLRVKEEVLINAMMKWYHGGYLHMKESVVQLLFPFSYSSIFYRSSEIRAPAKRVSVKAASHRIRLRLTIRLMANGSLPICSKNTIADNPAYLKQF